MRLLLDVNCLIALLDEPHAFHGIVSEWFLGSVHAGWMTCPITENGAIRILSNSGYARPKPAIAVVQALREASADPHHHFIADDFSLTDGGWTEPSLLTSQQVTDLYLLKLAIKNNARFITLDRRIKYSMVEGAHPDHLFVIGNQKAN